MTEERDPIEMLRGLTMAFMLLLSKQPNMTIEFDIVTMREFPYDDFALSAMSDELGNQTFMLVCSDIVH